MEDKLIELLESLGYPVFRQGSLNESDAYPDNFFTFWNTDSPDHSYYSDSDYGTDWSFDVNFYSNNPDNTYSVLTEARILLKQNGWIVPSKGYDLVSDEPTHTGRGMIVLFLEI